VNGKLQVLDGWNKANLGGKQYPSSTELIASGFSGSGELIVNGTMNINGLFVGTVQTTGNTGVIKVGNGDGVELKGKFTHGTGIFEDTIEVLWYDIAINIPDNLVHYELDANARIGRQSVTLEKGKTYYAVSNDQWTKDSFTMTGWTNGGQSEVTINQPMRGAWAENFTVNFDANGGTGSMAAQVMSFNTATALNANTFTREGYVFAGWSTTADGKGGRYTDAESVTFLPAHGASITLYAQWHQHSYGDWQNEAGYHYKACECGEQIDKAACSGGTATCTTPAICDVCKQTYGAVDDNAHAWDNDCDTTCNRGCGATREPSHDYEANVTAPTCTEKGYTTYTCVCGDTYVDDEVAATGEHNYVDGTCDICGEAEEAGCETGNHTYTNDADSTCNLCGEKREDVIPLSDNGLVFYKNYLSFQEYIGMQPLIRNSVLANYKTVYVKAIQTPVNGESQEPIVLDLMVYSAKYMYVDMQVMAWDMTDNISMILYGVTEDGIVYEGDKISTSVEELALEKLASLAGDNSNEKACRLLVDMLNYGAEVQTAFDHNVTNLPNTQLTAYSHFATTEEPDFSAEVTSTGTATITDRGMYISMQAQVELQMYIKPKDSIEKYELRVTPINGGETVTYDYTTFAEMGNGYYAPRFALKAAQFRDNFKMAIYNKDTGEVVTKIYTASAEAKAQAYLGNEKYEPVVIALMKYGDSVYAYANS
jgi:uncharacterized repeat protein (TIGR02543 family)